MHRNPTRFLPAGDYSPSSVLMLWVIFIVAGPRVVRHVEHLKDDRIVERSCGIKRVPSCLTTSRQLGVFTAESAAGLLDVNHAFVRFASEMSESNG